MRWGDLVSVNICILNEPQQEKKVCFGRTGQNEEQKNQCLRGQKVSSLVKENEKSE